MFDHPLKKKEIISFLQQSVDLYQFETALDMLLAESVVFKFGEFYCLHHNHALIEKRIRGNQRAAEMLQTAAKGAKLLSKFPYVRGVAISGSLSKNVADEYADIDYFIIAAANRMWIARSFLHLFKKVTFVFNKQHLYCMNYFIDEQQPEIIEKNIYTATEVATMLPLYGNETFGKFYAANEWALTFLPNRQLGVVTARQVKPHVFRSVLEKAFNNGLGNRLDNFLMKITANSWANKANKKKMNSRGIVMALDTSRHHAKPSPVNFQHKLLRQYENKLAQILDNYEQVIENPTGV